MAGMGSSISSVAAARMRRVQDRLGVVVEAMDRISKQVVDRLEAV